jgi:hypothetical protein
MDRMGPLTVKCGCQMRVVGRFPAAAFGSRFVMFG